jgi:Transglycosylase SLT domain
MPIEPVVNETSPSVNDANKSFFAAYEQQCSILKNDPNATDEYRRGIDNQVSAVRKQCGVEAGVPEPVDIEDPEGDTPPPPPGRNASDRAGDTSSNPFLDATDTGGDTSSNPVRNAIDRSGDAPPPANNAPSKPIDETMPANLPPALQAIWADIVKAAKMTGMDPALLAAMIWQESRGVGSASSVNGGNGANDAGLMQVNAATFAELQKLHPELQGLSLSDNFANILAGAFYLKDMKDKFGSDGLALRGYNSGPLSVDRSDANVTTTGLGDPTYVAKVLQFAEDIKNGKSLPA